MSRQRWRRARGMGPSSIGTRRRDSFLEPLLFWDLNDNNRLENLLCVAAKNGKKGGLSTATFKPTSIQSPPLFQRACLLPQPPTQFHWTNLLLCESLVYVKKKKEAILQNLCIYASSFHGLVHARGTYQDVELALPS